MTYKSLVAVDSTNYNSVSYCKKEKERLAKSSLQSYSFNSRSYSIKTKDHTSDELVLKILKACINKKRGIHPRIFCRRWFGLEQIKNGQARYREEQIIAMESEYGYREKCINLLARLLKIKPNTIQRWGKGVEFNRICPDKLIQYEIYLGYIDTIRVMTTSFAELDRELLINFAHNFLEK